MTDLTVGIVPVEGRGSLPFALLRGESLVAVASWALGEAGVRLLDFDTSWEQVRELEADLVVHDPLCPGTPVAFLEQAVEAAGGGAVVVGMRPVTDTVRHASGAVLGDTVDRDDLAAVLSPVVIPAAVVSALAELPATDDLAELVAVLARHHDVRRLDAPPTARRIVDASDLAVLDALLAEER